MFAKFAVVSSLLRWVVFPLAAYVLALGYARRPVPPVLARAAIAGTAIVALALCGSAVTATHHPQQWDFVCFWLYGHAAIAHQNVYDPAVYRALALPIAVDQEFRREVIDVGFPYPPPSILLFVPLGLFANITIAGGLWLTAFLLALLGGIAVLARSDKHMLGGSVALVAIAALAFALPASADNVAYHQTSFLSFLLVALAYRARGSVFGGVAAGLAVVVKPYLAAILLWFALRRRWNALAASIVTLAVATIAALPFLGRGAVHTFLFNNPAAREPAGLYAESEIASLYAAIVRAFAGGTNVSGPLHDPIFLTVALAALVFSVFVIVKARAGDDDLSLPIALTLGLMLYPGTGTMYAIVLVPALVALARRVRSPRFALLFSGFALAFFSANAGDGASTFGAFAALWILLGTIVVRYPASLEISALPA